MNPNFRRPVLIAALLTALLATTVSTAFAADTTSVVKGSVVRVVDGDTVIVKVGKVKETVRVLGIDTPETKKPGVAVQCGGPEASKRATALLKVGAPVTLESDASQPARDVYGRKLAHVRLASGQLLSSVLLSEGLAVRYRKALTAYDETFRELELAAMLAKVGNWSLCPRG